MQILGWIVYFIEDTLNFGACEFNVIDINAVEQMSKLIELFSN